MKKLVIASAVAAVMASGSVLADTTFGGNIRLELANQTDLELNSGKLTFDIKASEDLGNGMTGIARIEYEHDNADYETGGITNDLSYVGLKGDFGQVTAGVQDDAAGFACGATDIFVNNTGSACGVGAQNGPLDNAVVYANTFGAVTAVVGLTFDGDVTVAGASDGSQPAAGSHTVIALNYDAGSFQIGGQITSPDSDLNVEDLTVFGGSVKLGEGTLGLTFADNGADDNNTAYAVAYAMPLAGGTIKVGIDAGDALDTADGDTTTNIQFDKKLSKAVYTGAQFSSVDGVEDDLIQGYLGYKF